MTYDVVVVGAGTAGMPCAIALAEGGASVLLVEQDAAVGGTLHLSAGHMTGAGSRRQRAAGVADSPDAHFDDVWRISHGKADPAVVRIAVDEAPRTLDWLDDLGFPYPDVHPTVADDHEPYSAPRAFWGPELGVSILRVVKPRLEQLVEDGRIELRLQHRVTGLLVEDGRVAGVRAEGPGGPVELRATAVALTSGGCTGDPAVFAQLHPGQRPLLGGRHTSTGQVTLAALAAGAAFRGAEHYLSSMGGIESPVGSGLTEVYDGLAIMNPYQRPVRELWVNAAGERFIAEDDPSIDRLERAQAAQGGHVWIVCDEASLSEESPPVMGWSLEMLREAAARGEGAWSADDIPSLARRAGLDPDGLARTVAAWNEACRTGADPLGRRLLDQPVATAPFYAIATQGFTVIAWGGLAVDGELRVLDAGGTPIPGLYAAGEAIGAGALMGDAYCSGMMVTPALGLGRRLGRQLAARRAAL